MSAPIPQPSDHHVCRTCDVRWRGPFACWMCGSVGEEAQAVVVVGSARNPAALA
jgi:hypothetical protein